MAILQISKIQQRSGNLVDLPQLDDAEFGWANDAKRLFIGKTTPNENIEILTSYSQISFSQIDGAIGNLNISNVSLENGQVLAYDGTDWVNKGGTAGGLLTLGDVGNVKITGGAVGYVLETDGTGNLSWTPKGTLAANILNVSQADPALVTTVNENFFQNGSQVTITNPQGMDQLTGGVYYANVITSTTFELYTDFDGVSFSGNVDSTGYNAYSYTTVSATTFSTDEITVADANVFTVGQAVRFIGNMSTSNVENNLTYYVANIVDSTTMKISTTTDTANTVLALQTTTGLTAEVYAIEGQAIASLGSTVSFPVAGGSDTQVQYNDTGALTGNSAFTYDYGNSILTLVGNANVTNLNATGVVAATRLTSNIATGTAPLVITSTTQVANLNVATSGSVVNGNSNVNIPAANGNVNISAVGNANIVIVTGTGVNVAGTFNATGNANVGNLGANTAIITTGNITTINSGLLRNGNSNITITANANITLTARSNATVVISDTGANITGTANISGNANVGNLGTSGLIVATGNVTGGNLVTSGALSVTGNANVGNLGTAGLVVATGNVSGGNLVTAGSLSVTGNANVGNLGTGGLITATGNVTGGNITTAGVVSATGNVSGGNITTAGVVAATGNVNGGNLTTIGVVAATGNVSGGNVTTTGVVSATGNVSGGNLTTAGAVAASGNISGSNVVATSYHIRSITTGITAAGSTQGAATALTKEINVVSTVSSGANGVALPTAVAGMVLIVNNTSANTLNVYPATGGVINSGSTNAAYSHSSGASIQYYATSGTQWYTVGATFA